MQYIGRIQINCGSFHRRCIIIAFRILVIKLALLISIHSHSICYETHTKALDIIEGRKVDPTFYPVIYGAGTEEDWTDPKVWKKANPSLGETIGMDKVKAACDSARQNPGE